MQGLFNSPTQLLVLLVVILLVFGASRLPNTARQLGRSMRIFKSEMKEMKADSPPRTDKAADAHDADSARIEALEGRIVDTGPHDARQRDTRTGASAADTDRDR